jgi:hypothetical protein
MTFLKTATMLGLALGLSGCVGNDLATRNQPMTAPEFGYADEAAAKRVILSPQYTVMDVRISVPETLVVSEANSYYPIADVVWRGDAPGNRYTQIKAIFEDAFASATVNMTAGPEVIVEAEVVRFHCLTEKTRYTIGGDHSLRYMLTVRDAQTGAVMDGPRLVVADIAAAGGEAALAEERAGRTQKVVVTEALRNSLLREISAHQTERPISRGASDIPLTVQRLWEQAPLPH